MKRLRNLGALVAAMADGTLDKVAPEVRSDQVSLCIALVTGPGGPKQQKGYPWSLTKGEVVEMDFDYFDKKKLTVIPSAMDFAEGVFKSDGSRVAYLLANATVKAGQTMAAAAEPLRQKLLNAFDNGKIRVIPREDDQGNRLALRRDIGVHYQKAEALKSRGQGSGSAEKNSAGFVLPLPGRMATGVFPSKLIPITRNNVFIKLTPATGSLLSYCTCSSPAST